MPLKLLLHLDQKRIEKQAESTVRVTLLNATRRAVQVYGFWETPAGGPELGTYLEFAVLRIVNGGKVPVEKSWYRTTPDLDDIFGKVYSLPRGQEWSQVTSGWLPRPKGKSLPLGSYEVTAEFDDAHVARIFSKSNPFDIGRIDSAPVKFEIVGE